jgi:hypothetical protein
MKGSVAARGDDVHEALTLLRYGRIDANLFLRTRRCQEDSRTRSTASCVIRRF